MNYFVKLLRSIWQSIKKFFVKVLNFMKNILSFFRNRNRLRKLKEDSDIMAISIKDNLNNGNYHIVNCLYNKELEEITDLEEDTIGIETEQLDNQTKNYFGNKNMIVLQ